MLYVCVKDAMDVVFFCLYCGAWSCRCSCMGSVSVSSCCLFVSCMHLVAVLNAEFCMTCSLLMLVDDARGDLMEGYQRQQPTSGGTVMSSDLQIVVISSLQTVSSTVFRTQVSFQAA